MLTLEQIEAKEQELANMKKAVVRNAQKESDLESAIDTIIKSKAKLLIKAFGIVMQAQHDEMVSSKKVTGKKTASADKSDGALSAGNEVLAYEMVNRFGLTFEDVKHFFCVQALIDIEANKIPLRTLHFYMAKQMPNDRIKPEYMTAEKKAKFKDAIDKIMAETFNVYMERVLTAEDFQTISQALTNAYNDGKEEDKHKTITIKA